MNSMVIKVSNLHDIEELPVYAQPLRMVSTQEAVNLLLSSELSDSRICTRVPFSVEVNALFVVDLNQLSSPNDIICDDMGVWKWSGSSKRWVLVDDAGFVAFIKEEDIERGSCYFVWKRYYCLKSSPDVKRMIIILHGRSMKFLNLLRNIQIFLFTDYEKEALNLALVQYYYSQGEHKVKIAPHGNSRSGEPYVRTMSSVLCKLKEESKKSTPKRVLQFVSNEAGGIMSAASAGALPRNRQQVKDARRQSSSKQDYDPLYSVMYMCKQGEGKGGNGFIKMVNAAPFPMMVMAHDYSLDDLVRFCTSSNGFSILGVDPTFNLGEFDVTVTTYRHLLLQHHRDPEGKSPVMLGPMFVHVRKDFSTYHFFASSLVGQRPQLSSLKAFGTDGELALENALAATFPCAQHVRCFLHFRGNIERKLDGLNIPRAIASEIVKDIMGCPTQLQHGLVDSDSVNRFDDMLAGFRARWNELEKPYNSPPVFHGWFVKHCRDVIVKYMLPYVREKAGLGSPPSPYYTNEVESKNKVLKEKVEYKSCQLPEFVEKINDLIVEQKNEVERAIISTGEYRIRKEYSHLAVESSRWFKMNREQRQRKIDRFMKTVVTDNNERPSTSSLASPCPLDSLELPSQLKESMMVKANDLANDETAIVQAPGDDSAWIVRSYHGKRPHYVKASKSSFSCDEQCLSYKSMKVCSHTLAVAMKTDSLKELVKAYRSRKRKPSFTALAEAGKPPTAGKKPKRKGVSKKSGAQIKKMIADAKSSEWHSRDCNETPQFESDESENLDDSEYGSSHLHSTPVTNPLQAESVAKDQSSPHHQSVTCNAGSFVVTQSDVQNIHFGNICGTTRAPPPLIPAILQSPVVQCVPTTYTTSSFAVAQDTLDQKPFVDTPFWLAFLFGNVSRCNGCKGKIARDVNSKVLPPPDDIVFGHKEFVVFLNPRSGMFEQSREKRNVYYHTWKTCIAPHFMDFDPCKHIFVSSSVKQKLLPVHKALLAQEFGLMV